MPDSQKFYLTTPIYYVNARPHIGHAYTTLAADVIARRHRLLGDDTFFLTGTDEHGQKIERSAAAAGIAPQQFADEVSASFENLWKRMGITHDRFIRTTSAEHKRGAQRLFADLHARGQIYLSSYTGQYSVGEEMFVEGPPGTIGPDGRPTETVTEENFFFRLSEYQEKLLNLIESNELHIQPEARRNEVLSFLRGNVAAVQAATQSSGAPSTPESHPGMDGNVEPSPAAASAVTKATTLAYSALGTPYVPGALRDLSVSRSSFTWGIPVPEPAASETKERHVIYVWLDALANYMTALGYGSEIPEDIARFEKYWPADLHLVGKEIIRFHCVYWPAFLMAAGLPLPKGVTAHGWLLFDDSKMSKSKGNIVRTETILDAFGTLCPPQPLPSQQSSSFAEGGGPAIPSDAPPTPPSQGTAPLKGTPDSQSTTSLKGTGFSPSITEPKGNAALAAEGPTATDAEAIATKAAAPATSPLLSSRSAAEGSASPEPPTAPTKAEQDLFATDVLRYFLLREIPFGNDGSFNFDALITRYNADLASGYGNLVSRTFKMISNYFGNIIPKIDEEVLEKVITLVNLQATFAWKEKALAPLHLDIENYRFDRYLQGVTTFISVTDQTISLMAPWKERETETATIQNRQYCLYYAWEMIRIITALLYPILPNATAKVWSQLGLGDIEQAAKNGELKNLQWGGLKPGTKLGPLAPIFPRADKGLAQIMIDIEAGQATPTTPAEETAATPAPEAPAAEPAVAATPDTPQITIDDFVKIDLRVAKILVAERIPKADKLLRLEVDLGYEKRQILSGIAQWYTPEELIGRRIVVIANLAPRKMRGLMSHGMLLAASEGEDGKPILATFAEEIALGSRIK